MMKAATSYLEQTGYLRRPFKNEWFHSDSYEALNQKKEVIAQREIAIENQSPWSTRGQGEGGQIKDQNKLFLTAKNTLDSWPPGAPADGDYTSYGEAVVYHSFPDEDWQEFNRLSFDVWVDCQGLPNPHLIVGLKNDGVVKVPDVYNREGYHVVNLNDQKSQRVFLDFPDLPRDAITELSFSTLINGQDKATGETLYYEISAIKVEKVADLSPSKGWLPKENEIIYGHQGYQTTHQKTAWLIGHTATVFSLHVAETDESVFSSDIHLVESSIGSYQVLDFSKFEEVGTYYLQVGDTKTASFKIDSAWNLWVDSIWTSLNFIFCQRCGCLVPDRHTSCHEDITATHQGQQISFNGGWHDAGDLSQQLVQTAEVALSLFEMAAKVKDQDHGLYLRLLEEAEWGYDFILKTRFGDGYRATSAGLTRWTNGKIGDMDDVVARVHNTAYENFLLAGIEAKIAGYLEEDNRLKKHAVSIALADFQFALDSFKEQGYQTTPIFWEHTYSTSKSTYLATMVWASSAIYQLTHEEIYETLSTQWMTEMLACQESEGIELFSGEQIKGFFYRDDSHKVIQHFNHQAREHLYAQAFEGILEAFPTHPERSNWLRAATSYGHYFTYLQEFTAPYPMLASGLYFANEREDTASFDVQHLLVGEEAKTEYLEQLAEGIEVGPGLYVKRFPVWFSFRGNNAMVLSTGKAVAILGNLLNDDTLQELGAKQLDWLVGANPFNQSLIYGIGRNYAQQYAVLPGEMVGEIPVGIQTFGNEDAPYWPQLNNATYKEIWTGNAGKWLALICEVI